MSPRYAKFLLALVGAVGTLLVVLVEQNANLIPRDWQPWVMFAYSLAVAFGVRQIPNRPPAGEAPRPDMSEQDGERVAPLINVRPHGVDPAHRQNLGDAGVSDAMAVACVALAAVLLLVVFVLT